MVQQCVAGDGLESFIVKSPGDFTQAKIPGKNIVPREGHIVLPSEERLLLGERKGH
jgi:hypothetical protein